MQDYHKVLTQKEIKEIKDVFESRKTDSDTRMQTKDNIKKQFANLDDLQNRSLWPSAEQELKDIYYEAEKMIKDSDNSQHKSALDRFKKQMENVLKQLKLIGNLSNSYYSLTDSQIRDIVNAIDDATRDAKKKLNDRSVKTNSSKLFNPKW